MASALSSGILLACGTMLPRMLLVASVMNQQLLMPLLLPAAVMALLTYLPAVVYLRARVEVQADVQSPMRNPLELRSALLFGALLAAVLLLSEALRHGFGDAGLLALAAASGVTDVDAITLSLARMSQETLATDTAAIGLIIAAAVNNLTKAGMAVAIGGRSIALRAGLPLTGSALAGLLIVWW